jgi:hypothetical protein
MVHSPFACTEKEKSCKSAGCLRFFTSLKEEGEKEREIEDESVQK